MNQKKSYSVEDVREKLETNQAWLERAIVRLYEHQTNEEQEMQQTSEDNGVGFNAVDAHKLSYYATWIKAGNHLSDKYLQDAFKRVPKYSKQIFKLINDDKKS